MALRESREPAEVLSASTARNASGDQAELVAIAKARVNTASSIAGVSRPVNVFCCDGWYDPTTVYGPIRTSAPCPNRGFGVTEPAPTDATARSVASQPKEPRARMARTPLRRASSRARNGAHASRSSIVETGE